MSQNSSLELNVYAINNQTFTPPSTRGVQTTRIGAINPTRRDNAGDGEWIGKCKPSNFASIYTEIEVASDMSSDRDFYYENRSVAQINTALNA